MARAQGVSALVGDIVREIRERRQFTQETVAEGMRALGYDEWRQKTVSGIESGLRAIYIDELFGLSLVLQEPIDELLPELSAR